LHCAPPVLSEALLNPGFIKNITRIFHKRMSYDNWVKHIGRFATVGERLRGYLCLLSERSGTVRETQTYLANIVGCSRQTINRELSNLREAGLIEQSGSVIKVLDRAAVGDGLIW
jgi:CRP-like cAMP-binding protein